MCAHPQAACDKFALEASIERYIRPSVLLCLSECVCARTLLTIGLTEAHPSDDTGAQPIDVHVFAAPLTPALAASWAEPIDAIVLGPPRHVPKAKQASWVAQRQYLEDAKPAGVGEVLLCSEDGRLLEGLVTNLFVVTSESDEGEP